MKGRPQVGEAQSPAGFCCFSASNTANANADKKFVALLIPRLGKVSLDLAEQAADAFRQMGDEYLFAPRRHPSDPIDLATYEKIFEGVPTLSALGFPHDILATAADLVVAQRSCTGLQEAVRQRLGITLTMGLDPGFTFPLVDARVSAPALPVDLPWLIPELLEGVSPLCEDLRERMRSLKTDGHAARRVADIVLRAMAQT